MTINPDFINWLLQAGGVAAQAYFAFLAQTNPKWAWVNAAFGAIQGMTMPSLFKKKE